MKIHELKKRLMNGEKLEPDRLYSELEKARSKHPVVYNIETTNACNMKCKMCPRTTMMTRPVSTMDMPMFKKAIEHIVPHSEEIWNKWVKFAEKEYKIPYNSMGENHFFLYIVTKTLVLHGYGEPILDKDLSEKIRLLTEKKIPTYFSCNPANIDVDECLKMFKAGLGYIKFSIESVDDLVYKNLRGPVSNFSVSYPKILKLLEEKKKNNYKTTIVITMIDMQQGGYDKLVEAFKDKDVYIYLKSQDQQWYENKNVGTNSIHWSEFCHYPWSSTTIQSNGDIILCNDDWNNESKAGNIKTDSLYDVWNGKKYDDYRKRHLLLNIDKCQNRCDMKLIGDYNVTMRVCPFNCYR